MKKRLVILALILMALIAMHMTVLGDPGEGGGPPPYCPPGPLSLRIVGDGYDYTHQPVVTQHPNPENDQGEDEK